MSDGRAGPVSCSVRDSGRISPPVVDRLPGAGAARPPVLVYGLGSVLVNADHRLACRALLGRRPAEKCLYAENRKELCGHIRTRKNIPALLCLSGWRSSPERYTPLLQRQIPGAIRSDFADFSVDSGAIPERSKNA